MVESILKCGELEARVTYRSPYSVASMLGGAETVRYGIQNGLGSSSHICVLIFSHKAISTVQDQSMVKISFVLSFRYVYISCLFSISRLIIFSHQYPKNKQKEDGLSFFLTSILQFLFLFPWIDLPFSILVLVLPFFSES